MKKFSESYESMISVENLLLAWEEFARGKRKKKDVQEFSFNLMDNILSLHKDLKTLTYVHGDYEAFNISDPKPRSIHKASVRDRLLHHAIHRQLYPFFDRRFVSDSFSSRKEKSVHKAMKRFRRFGWKVSENNKKTCWILKCDIKKFFASIDQETLLRIVGQHIKDKDIFWLVERVVKSFYSTGPDKGLPLGNLTSQLLVNIYMNEFDQFVKHKLKARYYVRYADDFVFLSQDKEWLESLIPEIADFFWTNLQLSLHPDKVYIKTLASGVDFLGWVHFPDHRVLRTTTKKRAFRGVKKKRGKEEILQSYLGLMSHGNAYKLQEEIKELYN
jgi:retron-type reverse transcriptase